LKHVAKNLQDNKFIDVPSKNVQ